MVRVAPASRLINIYIGGFSEAKGAFLVHKSLNWLQMAWESCGVRAEGSMC